MRFPYKSEPPFSFNLMTLDDWVATCKPAQIEMSDPQYALFASLSRANRKEYKGIPIVFLDAPQ